MKVAEIKKCKKCGHDIFINYTKDEAVTCEKCFTEYPVERTQATVI